VTKYIVDLPKDFEKKLSKLAEKEGVSMSEIFRRAFGFYSLFRKFVKAGYKMALLNEKGVVKKEIFMKYWENKDEE